MTVPRAQIRGVIFDLDGVLVTTDELHFQAWKELADRETIPFTRHDNERLKGVDRMRSLDIILEKAARPYSPAEKTALADAKNTRYRSLLSSLSTGDALPGARSMLEALRERHIPAAVGSASRNAGEILGRVGLDAFIGVLIDGGAVKHAKPDPEVFLLAAQRMGLPPVDCLVVEDAIVGVEAALRGGFHVLGIGDPQRLRSVAGGMVAR
jgi:beta-phosphoglucomutase